MEFARAIEGENFFRKVAKVNADLRDHAALRHAPQNKLADLLTLRTAADEAQSPQQRIHRKRMCRRQPQLASWPLRGTGGRSLAL